MIFERKYNSIELVPLMGAIETFLVSTIEQLVELFWYISVYITW